MTLQEFIDKYDDKFVEVGGSPQAQNQCVDLANAYLDEVLNEPMVFGADAVMFWDKTNLKQVSPDTFPQAGDIVIWNTKVGSHGHIAVSTGVLNGNKFQTFSQNWPLKSPCHLQDYELKNLIGYLRKDNMSQIDDLKKQLATTQELLLGRTKDYNALLDKELKWKKTANDLQVKVDELSKRPVSCPKCKCDKLTATELFWKAIVKFFYK